MTDDGKQPVAGMACDAAKEGHQRYATLQAGEARIAQIAKLLPPYAHAMGIAICGLENDTPILEMEFAAHLQGWPGLFHGGTLAGLLEMAGLASVLTALHDVGRKENLRPINHSTNFLREARGGRVYAFGRVTRLGGRNAHVQVEAWQSDRHTPVAEAVMNVMLKRGAGST